MTKTYNVLSIDMDYWAPEKIEYDWGHNESPIFISPMLWAVRCSDLLSNGIDLRKEMCISGDITPHNLVQVLGNHISTKAHVAISESHSCAFNHIQSKFNKKKFDEIKIWNIDAHHDLGYHGNPNLDCANWAEHAIAGLPVRAFTQVYPTWRDKDENPDWSPENAKHQMATHNVNIDVCYGIENINLEDVVFHNVFLARSGAWVPPWFDKPTSELAVNLFCHLHKPWDCTLYGFPDLDAIIRQDFNWEDVEKQSNAMKELKKDSWKPVITT